MKIAARYRPFSHEAGTACLIPLSSCEVMVYPTRLHIKRDSGNDLIIQWRLMGPIRDFTIMQDLEKHQLVVYGVSAEGYLSYRLFSDEGAIVVQLERATTGQLKGLVSDQYEIQLKLHEKFALFADDNYVKKPLLERLSFGLHKSQDWRLVRRRNSPQEYLPFWFALGQQIPVARALPEVGVLRLVKKCKELLDQGDKENLLQNIELLFAVGFEGLLAPRIYDHHYLGCGCDPLQERESTRQQSMSIISEGYQLIRGMLFQASLESIKILPHLPVSFHCGRCFNLQLKNDKGETVAYLDLEWSKKLIKKIKITSSCKLALHFSFQKPLKTFRLKHPIKARGVRYHCHDIIEIPEGISLLDCFEK